MNCPECDTVFEPPDDVWLARCPFCSCEVEVPHAHGHFNAGEFRMRLRKQPGWLIRLRAHLPGWANPVMVLSFSLLLLSLLMQAWMATHLDRSATAMSRAIADYKSLDKKEIDDQIKSCDTLLAAWGTESAKAVAEQDGLKQAAVQSQRRSLMRDRWNATLALQYTQPAEAALKSIAELVEQAKADHDLSDLAQVARSQWQKRRHQAIQTALDQAQAAMANRNAAQAAQDLLTAERFWLETLAEVPLPAEFESTIASFTRHLATWRGIRLDVQMNSTTFTTADQARPQVSPVLSQAWQAKGYVLPEFKSKNLNRLFQESSRFLINARIAERYGRGFEETPHRTTILEVKLALLQNGREVWSQVATARTPRIPARTAMGMSRLQLSKQSDEKIEKKLNEAAWESLPAALSQPLQLLEDAAKLAPTALQI